MLSPEAAQTVVTQPFIDAPTNIYDKPYPPWQPLDTGALGDSAHCATKTYTLTLGGAELAILDEACAFALGTFLVQVQQTDRGMLA